MPSQLAPLTKSPRRLRLAPGEAVHLDGKFLLWIFAAVALSFGILFFSIRTLMEAI
jgi:hypothetical protein